MIGKSINFIRQCCQDERWAAESKHLRHQSLSRVISLLFQACVCWAALQYGDTATLEAVVNEAAEVPRSVSDRRLIALSCS